MQISSLALISRKATIISFLLFNSLSHRANRTILALGVSLKRTKLDKFLNSDASMTKVEPSWMSSTGKKKFLFFFLAASADVNNWPTHSTIVDPKVRIFISLVNAAAKNFTFWDVCQCLDAPFLIVRPKNWQGDVNWWTISAVIARIFIAALNPKSALRWTVSRLTFSR